MEEPRKKLLKDFRKKKSGTHLPGILGTISEGTSKGISEGTPRGITERTPVGVQTGISGGFRKQKLLKESQTELLNKYQK